MQFLSFSRKKSPKFFPVWPFVFVFLMNIKGNNRFTDSLVEYFKKNTENAKFPDFQFHNLKFSQERYFGPFILLQPLTYIYESCLGRAL